MNQEQYESFVARLEAQSEQSPRIYKAKLAGMAVLGYAYVAAILALLLAVLALFGWMIAHRSAAVLAIKLGIFIVPLVWAVVRAMCVRLEPPSGMRITRQSAPQLFDLIEETRACARAPHAREILITNDFNAAVVQHPRLGVFGWPKNYLVLGLPLMQAVTVEELRAIIAHEFGHLSGAHGKFGAWIYRLRAGWARLAHALEESDHWGKFLFVPFFHWYAPAFAAFSFVQARRQEYEADRVSAEAAGPAVAAAALVRVEVQADFLQREFWKRVFSEADVKSQPDAQPFAAMRLAFAQAHGASGASGSLEAALKVRTGYDDTHPCLSDRLNALGTSAALPAPLASTAAEKLLGAFVDELAAGFDREWQRDVAQWWEGRHKYASESRTKLAALDAASGAGELAVDDAFLRAQFTEELVSEASAIGQLEALLVRAPEHAPTRFALGRLKLARDDESGIELLRGAMQLDHSAAQAACTLIVDYLRRHGRNEEARPYIDNLIDAGQRDRKSQKERGQLLISDKFVPHELPAETLGALVEQLARFEGVQRAYLVRKQTKHYADVPLYALAVERKKAFWKLESAVAGERLVAQLSQEIQFPGELLIICLDGNKNFRAKFKKVAQSDVYTRAS